MSGPETILSRLYQSKFGCREQNILQLVLAGSKFSKPHLRTKIPKELCSSSLRTWHLQNYGTTATVWKLPESRSCHFHSQLQNHTLPTVIWTSKMDAPPMLLDVHKANDWTMRTLLSLIQKKKFSPQLCLSEKQTSRSYTKVFVCWNLHTSIKLAATGSGECDFWLTSPLPYRKHTWSLKEDEVAVRCKPVYVPYSPNKMNVWFK